MKKILAVFLSLSLVASLSCNLFTIPVSAEYLELTPDVEQQIFDVWFDFLYDDFTIPMNTYYDSFEEYKAAEKDKILKTDTNIYCYYNYEGNIVVQVINSKISAIDLIWYENIGNVVFDFSGVDPALYAYNDGKLYNLIDAYDKEIVDDNCIDGLVFATHDIARFAGDMDGDFTLSVSDIVSMREMIMSDEYAFYADIDSDDKITVTDIVAFRNKIMN